MRIPSVDKKFTFEIKIGIFFSFKQKLIFMLKCGLVLVFNFHFFPTVVIFIEHQN